MKRWERGRILNKNNKKKISSSFYIFFLISFRIFKVTQMKMKHHILKKKEKKVSIYLREILMREKRECLFEISYYLLLLILLILYWNQLEMEWCNVEIEERNVEMWFYICSIFANKTSSSSSHYYHHDYSL